MTAPTLAPSAYPAPIDALLPQARDLASALGEIPSRNRLMKELRVGAPKAIALREALTQEADDHQYQADTLTYHLARGHIPNLPDTTTDPAAAHDTTDVERPTDPAPAAVAIADIPLLDPVGHPGTNITETVDVAPTEAPVAVKPARRPVAWPVLLLALPAFVAIWAGWVELGKLTGFGKVNLLPGIGDGWVIDTAISLPIGVETYAAYALWVWLSGRATAQARRFAKWSAIASLTIGALGQITYHLMAAAGWTSTPWLITAAVACLPVAVLGMGAALAHLLHTDH